MAAFEGGPVASARRPQPLDDPASHGIPLHLPSQEVGLGGHVACDGLLEPLVDVAAGLPTVPDHIQPFGDVEVVGADPLPSPEGDE